MARAGMKTSLLWNYFQPSDNSDYLAECNFCPQHLLSYKTTISNLKHHLKRKHKSAYNDFLVLSAKRRLDGQSSPSLDKETISSKIDPEKNALSALQQDLDLDEDSNSSKKFCAEVWEQFEIQDSAAHCAICDKVLENTIEDMKSHLEEAHPLVLINILSEHTGHTDTAADDLTDVESVQDCTEKEAFSEVVYLEEKQLRNQKPKISSSSEMVRKPSNTSGSHQEIDSFLNYVGVLLKSMDEKSQTKLQLDIISMILKQRSK